MPRKRNVEDTEQESGYRREDEACGLLRTLESQYGLDSGAKLADALDTSEPSVTRFRKGEKDEIGTLVPTALKLMYPATSGIAFEAQCAEYDLRKAHFDLATATAAGAVTEDYCDALDSKLERAEDTHAMLRERLGDLIAPSSAKKAERAIDRAALDSLEGQIATYRREFELGAAAFTRALANLKDTPLRDFGAKVLATRAMLVLYYCSHMYGVDVSARVADPTFVRMAKAVAFATGDARILILVAEAVATLAQHKRAAVLLHDAAELRSMSIKNLPTFQPVGYTEALRDIAVFAEPLALVPEIAARAEARVLERESLAEQHFGLPNDVTLHDSR